MKPQKIFIVSIVITLVLISIVSWLVWKSYQLQKGEVLISTDKTEYGKAGTLTAKIKNGFNEQICFSSCYPYLLERKNENWDSYQYNNCSEPSGNGSCVGAKEEKNFELALPEVPGGLHRLSIPVCVNCKKEDSFKEDKKFYSNEFLIKD